MLRPGAETIARPRRARPVHRLGRPDADRLRRLPGLLARARRSTTTASRSARTYDGSTPPPHAGGGGRRRRSCSAPTSRWCSTSARRCRRRPTVIRLAVERTAAWAERARAAHRPRRPGAVRHRAGRRRRGAARRERRSGPSSSTSTATASAGCRWGRPAPRCCPALAAALGAPARPTGPRYLMGVGDPAVAGRGGRPRRRPVRLRACRPGSAATAPPSPAAGKLHLKNARHARSDEPVDPDCACQVCARHSRGYLRHLFQVGEPTAWPPALLHNLAWTLELMDRMPGRHRRRDVRVSSGARSSPSGGDARFGAAGR